MTKMGDWHEYLMERLADRKNAISYLEVSLEEYQEDGDAPFFLIGLRNVVDAQGGISVFAKQNGLDPKVLLGLLSGECTPQLDIFISIVTALGGRLAIAPLKAADMSEREQEQNYLVPSQEVEGQSFEVAPNSQ